MTGSLASRLICRWVLLVQQQRTLITLVVLLLTAMAAGYAYLFGGINSDLSRLITPSDDIQWYADNERFKAAFPEQEQTAVVVVSGADVDRVQEAARSLRSALVARDYFELVFAPGIEPFLLEKQAYYPDPEQLADWLRGVRFNYGTLLRLADGGGAANVAVMLADQVEAKNNLPVSPPLASLVDSLLDDEPGARLNAYPRLVDPDIQTHYQLIIVKAAQQVAENLPNAEIVATIRAVIDNTPRPDGTAVALTGEVVLAHEEISAALNGVGIAGLVSLVLLAIILGVGIGSLRVIALIFAMLAIGITWTMAWATFSVGRYNTLSLIFVVMFFGLGVDFAVHFALRVREAIRVDAADNPYLHAARDIGPALALCALTSMIAFLSFLPTPYRGLGELGLISAGGMIIALVLTLTLVPLLQVDLRGQSHDGLRFAMTPLPPVRVIGVVLLLAAVAASQAVNLRFDYSVLAMRDASTEGMRTLLQLQQDEVATDYSIKVIAPPESVADLSRTLTALPAVAAVTSIADLVPQDQDTKAAQLQTVAALLSEIEAVEPEEPDSERLGYALDYLHEAITNSSDADKQDMARALASRLASLKPAELAALNDAILTAVNQELKDLRTLLTASPFTAADLPESLTTRMVTDQGEQLLVVQPAGALDSREATGDFIAAVSPVAPNIAGRAVVEWGVGNVVVESFGMALAIAFTSILILLHLYFRSFTLPWLVLVPIALALLFAAAVCEATGLSLNMANILVVPLIIGLGVDTGIHVVDRYTHSDSVDTLFHSSTARAAVISALTTIGTFISLSFSPHQGAASVGLLLAIAISFMLAFTLLVLPALLRILAPARQVSP